MKYQSVSYFLPELKYVSNFVWKYFSQEYNMILSELLADSNSLLTVVAGVLRSNNDAL